MNKGLVAGLTTIASGFSPRETMDRLENLIRASSMTVFARIDHAAGAREAGLELRPTELIIFGHARGGTPLMQSVQSVGIDLPLKALVWEDAAGQTWLSFDRAEWIAGRHNIADSQPVVNRMSATLRTISRKATTDQPESAKPSEKDAFKQKN